MASAETMMAPPEVPPIGWGEFVLFEDLDGADLADRLDAAALNHGVVKAGLVLQTEHPLDGRLERVFVQFL